ncbi:MAG: hypothetical protein Q9160_003927 [Pyrenula sp. 1 TL-2023]
MSEPCANPLFLQWVKEWMDEARERNNKGFHQYKKAYDALKACPRKFNHPSEAQSLNGIGPKTSDRLFSKLKAHYAAKGLPLPDELQKDLKRKSDDEGPAEEKTVKKARKPKPYVPSLRSGAYALILALSTLEEEATIGLTKADTIDRAQPHCDASFTAPSDPTKFYTAWNSMKTLIGKDLVYEHGRPLRRYMLTEVGWEVAKRMQAAGGIIEAQTSQHKPSRTLSAPEPLREVSDHNVLNLPQRRTASEQDPNLRKKSKHRPVFSLLSSSPPPSPGAQESRENAAPQEHDLEPSVKNSTNTSLPSFTPIRLAPGSFSVHLLLDSREVRTKTDRDYISNELSARGITPITRALPLTDALWIARVYSPAPPTLAPDLDLSSSENVEIVLPHGLERKRLDDLISSIKDGRFHEQKFRLRKSGLRNITYLIEDFSLSAERSDRYGDAVGSAIANTQVVNGYFVKRTTKLDDSIRYLARMTRLLKKKYEGRELLVIPSEALSPQTYLPMVSELRRKQPDDEHDHCITYAAFSSLVSKSSTLSLRDVFLKMLMCTRGVTGEKALEIQKRWKTPRELVEALEEMERRDMTLDRGGGKGMGKWTGKQIMVSERLGTMVPRKKVARGLSGKIAEVWG